MASSLTSLCDAIVKDLNNGQFSLGFKATRKRMPRVDVEDLDQVQVTVTPGRGGSEWEPDSRTHWAGELNIDIGVQKKLRGDREQECDPLEQLTEEIGDHFRTQRPTGVEMPLVRIRVLPYAPEHIEQHGQYTGVVTLSFQEWRT